MSLEDLSQPCNSLQNLPYVQEKRLRIRKEKDYGKGPFYFLLTQEGMKLRKNTTRCKNPEEKGNDFANSLSKHQVWGGLIC